MDHHMPVLPPIDLGDNLGSSSGSSLLRKSLSVDSFSKPSRTSSVPANARFHPSTVIEDQEEHQPPPSAPVLHSEFPSTFGSALDRPPPRPSRTRNTSLGPADDNPDSPLYVKYSRKHIQMDRTKESFDFKPAMEDFSGPLASLSTPPSAALPRSRSSGFQDISRTAQAGPSQVPPRKSVSSRSRSGSLNISAPNGGVAMVINTQISASPSRSPVTVAVIGTLGSGKSTVIRKGCKAYSMSEPVSNSQTLDTAEPFQYVSRTGKIAQNQNPAGILRVIEVDLPDLKLTSASTTFWPESAPRIDGVIVCYDASDEQTFTHVEQLILGSHGMKIPSVVIACKSDMVGERSVDPQHVATILNRHQVGLVEVSTSGENGKDKMRRCFEWMIKAIYRDRSTPRQDQNSSYRNPASPNLVQSPVPWENNLINNTPPEIPSPQPSSQLSKSRLSQPSFPTPPSSPPHPPSIPNSPTRVKSANDLTMEYAKSQTRDRDEPPANTTRGSGDVLQRISLPSRGPNDSLEELDSRKDKRQDQRLAPWATMEELLDKLIFSVVSDDDRTYVSNFLLTYRRFARPRNIILTMQKRMRELDNQTSDPMFACLAQMSICRLLADWMREYPYDFAVHGTTGALSALVTSIIGKTHLIHYGLEFIPFLEKVGQYIDEDLAWAKKLDPSEEESDDAYSIGEGDDDALVSRSESPISSSPNISFANTRPGPTASSAPSRERKQSLPLTAKAIVMPATKPSNSNTGSIDSFESSPKQILRELGRISAELNDIPAADIAQEITRIETKLFLDIKPRHWLKHTLISTFKDPETDTIARFGHVSNHIAEWVASLILCHDKSKVRAKQIEKFVEIGVKLRALNNYSALRAIVAGINSATFVGDAPMDQFRQKNPEAWKSYQSWDLLFQAVRSHRAYRMALRNTKGACIPALEVHLLDLIRAHEGNQDYNSADPSLIHWAKYNMIGKFISGTMQSQDQCRNSGEYHFAEQPHIRDLLLKECIMDLEMQSSRTPQVEQDSDRVSLRNVSPRDYHQYPRDAALLRKIIFWAS